MVISYVNQKMLNSGEYSEMIKLNKVSSTGKVLFPFWQIVGERGGEYFFFADEKEVVNFLCITRGYYSVSRIVPKPSPKGYVHREFD